MRRYYPHRGWKRTYGVAVLLALAAFAVRYGIHGELASRLPFGFFTPAAMLAAWYGGVGPGFVAYVIGLILGDLFFLPSHDAFGTVGSTDSVALGVYTLTTATGIGLIEHLHITIRRMQRAAEREQAEGK